jgi:carboxylesterase type B
MQLSSTEPLFKRAIAMSGTPLMLKPLSASTAESTYESIIKALGFENISVEERIQRLITISPEELVEKTPMAARLAPFLDEDILAEAITFGNLVSGMQWCEALMIGDCQHDVRLCLLLFSLVHVTHTHRGTLPSSWAWAPRCKTSRPTYIHPFLPA